MDYVDYDSCDSLLSLISSYLRLPAQIMNMNKNSRFLLVSEERLGR